jgi:hypothetical protein
MTGKRVPGFDWHLWEPGDFGYSVEDECWIGITPNDHAAHLGRHTVVEHCDGTITVSPSILVSTSAQGKSVEVWHGYLEAGTWRAC